MSPCTVEQSQFIVPEDSWPESVTVKRKQTVVCPKPRRPSRISTGPDPSLRWIVRNQLEDCEAKAGNELILSQQVSRSFLSVSFISLFPESGFSPPFFSGSPPRRVSNPLIQDAAFVNEKRKPDAVSSPAPPPNFGNNPSVRIEGFSSSSRIPALA
ncbi:hypothetical protein M569_10724 [Genlisea aurea]|uniref:Uncharacterized protein n=1 Tax=Genlisea aurea TaxID=192259 RepID=S8DVV9_9LAMI|nr:hypothetical protein M569_10724 [Genlisea aurea]